MISRLDYVRVRSELRQSPERSAAPKWAAISFAGLFIVGWTFFFVLGGMMSVDTHFTNRPQDFREFRLTSWRLGARAGGSSRRVLTREAIWPLTMHTLRYRQESSDGGITVETVGYRADIRWGPTIVALFATAVLPLVVYFGLKRAARVSRQLHR